MRPHTLFAISLLFAVTPLHAEEWTCPFASWFTVTEEPAPVLAADDPATAEQNEKHDADAAQAPEPAAVEEPEPAADPAPSTTPAASRRMPVPGDCAVFRQGGEGYIFLAPTYHMKGKIVEIYRRPHYMGLCPEPGRTKANYKREDWLRFAEAYPCVSDPARVREIEAIRVKIAVEDWDTPWSVQHGRNGMLMGGYFLDIELKEGVVVDIDGTLLERCED